MGAYSSRYFLDLPQQFRYFVKADDDIYLDVHKIYNAITNEEISDDFIMGNIIHGAWVTR